MFLEKRSVRDGILIESVLSCAYVCICVKPSLSLRGARECSVCGVAAARVSVCNGGGSRGLKLGH
jgi:hypothetical protein